LRKIGIYEPDHYAKSVLNKLSSNDITYLSSCCFGSFFIEQIESDIEDSLNRNGTVDITVRKS
jgi:hypothetical protein